MYLYIWSPPSYELPSLALNATMAIITMITIIYITILNSSEKIYIYDIIMSLCLKFSYVFSFFLNNRAALNKIHVLIYIYIWSPPLLRSTFFSFKRHGTAEKYSNLLGKCIDFYRLLNTMVLQKKTT